MSQADLFLYRGVSVNIVRTDDIMEPPDDDTEASGPFELGDFHVILPEWGIQTSVTHPSAFLAKKFARAAVDAVTDGNSTYEDAMHVSGLPPIPITDWAEVFATDEHVCTVFHHDGIDANDPHLSGTGWYYQSHVCVDPPFGPYDTVAKAVDGAKERYRTVDTPNLRKP